MDLSRTISTWPSRVYANTGLIRGYVNLASISGYVLGTTTAALADEGVLNAFGTSAVARVLPTNPNSSLSTALGELKKDGLPSLPGSRMREQTDLARRAGNEFLNVEFGWLPLLNDVRAFADSVKRSRQLIDQYRRDSDRKIRRRFVPAPLVNDVQVFNRTGIATGGSFLPVTITRTERQEFWFSGAFRYHVPIGDDFYSRLRRYEQYSHLLFDTRLTPELLWNLAPWSWAIDWFSNAGDVIHNISLLGSDGLVMQYGYAMRYSLIDETARGFVSFTSNGKKVAGNLSRTFATETKQRRPAHPYGFGIDDLSLSAIQLAILSALGLTRGQRNGN
jgi:hypothetical protein